MFEYYKNVFGGSQIGDEQTFYRLLLYAKAFLERVKAPDAVMDTEAEQVKNGWCALCDALYMRLSALGLRQEQWDGFVREYNDRDLFSDLYKTACLFFPPALLYRGI